MFYEGLDYKCCKIDRRSGDGKCIIEIDQAPTAHQISDKATGDDIGTAAWELIDYCTGIHGRGGVASGLGETLETLNDSS